MNTLVKIHRAPGSVPGPGSPAACGVFMEPRYSYVTYADAGTLFLPGLDPASIQERFIYRC